MPSVPPPKFAGISAVWVFVTDRFDSSEAGSRSMGKETSSGSGLGRFTRFSSREV